MDFTAKINGIAVPVKLALGIKEICGWTQIKSFVPFVEYCQRMSPRLTVQSITIQSIDMFGENIGFMKILSDIVDQDGDRVPGICFLRGGSVVILVILHCQKNNKDYIVTVRQARSPIGAHDFQELPAGMIDGDNNFSGKAAKEIEEELGITIRFDELVDLTKLVYGDSCPGIFASPGASDEYFRMMFFKQIVPDISVFIDRKMQNAGESEKIITNVVSFDELIAEPWLINDAKTLAMILLYNTLRLSNRI